jgi:hypothetical protein
MMKPSQKTMCRLLAVLATADAAFVMGVTGEGPFFAIVAWFSVVVGAIAAAVVATVVLVRTIVVVREAGLAGRAFDRDTADDADEMPGTDLPD